MNTDKPIIDISPYLMGQKLINVSIDMLTQSLNETNRQLHTYTKESSREILERLKAGATTGDPLKDEILTQFGLNEVAIDKIMAFNQRLITAPESELLITISYQRRWRYGADCKPSDFHTCWGYIFGILSGERLRINSSPNLSATLPYKRHVICDFDGIADCECNTGNVTISCCSREPDPATILAKIMSISPDTVPVLQSTGFMGKSPTVLILIGDEIDNRDLPSVDCRVNPKHLRALLNTPTSGEKIQGEGI